MWAIFIKPFLAIVLSNGLKWIHFRWISKLLDFHISIKSCIDYSLEEQNNFECIIRRRHKHVIEGYIIKKFENYPYVMVITKRDKLLGLMFINYFEYNQENYVYVGPIFVLSKLALCLSGMYLVEVFSNKVKQLNFLGEIQNPEMIIHLHTVMPKSSTFPQIGTFYVSDKAREKLACFIDNVKQIDEIDKIHFKSKSVYSLFREREDQKPLLTCLKNHGIDLMQGDSLVMLLIVDQQAIPSIRKRVWYCLFTYPAHRIYYIQHIKKFLELHKIIDSKGNDSTHS
ncbi:MAG: hypothetical protein ACYC2U_03515 [Candidatus Amoebophilus sp.]